MCVLVASGCTATKVKPSSVVTFDAQINVTTEWRNDIYGFYLAEAGSLAPNLTH